jgi:ankyrin repeat protein/L-ascorbate metabolism protein UlaG (beta-lactamase superfamily)
MFKITMVSLFLWFCVSTMLATSIHELINSDDLTGIVQALQTNPELLEQRNESFLSPLNYAVCEGKLEMVSLMIDAGADIHRGDREGSQPLINAAAFGHLEIVKHLIGKGAEIDRLDDNGATALSFALARHQNEISLYLLNNGADPNLAQMTDLPGIFFPVINGEQEIIALMLEKGVDVNVVNRFGVSPIFSACSHGNLEITRYLVEQGANPNLVNNQGETPLFWAAARYRTDVIDYLIKLGANLNHEDEEGETPLFKAAGDIPTIQQLQTAGADINKLSNEGSNLLLNSVWSGNLEAVSYLAKILDVNLRNEYGTSGFYFSVLRDSMEMMRVFLENEADPEFGSKEEWQPGLSQTAIHLAANNGSIAPMQLLQEYGADINKLDQDRERTVLHYAVVNGDLALLKYLLSQGLDVEAKDKWDHTALYYAQKHGFTEIEQELLNNGAKKGDIYVKSQLGEDECQITYTGHSGWVIETEKRILIFDYWQNRAASSAPSLNSGYLSRDFLSVDKQVSFFVSHVHDDHYDENILDFADLDNVEYYFGFRPDREENVKVLEPREHYSQDGLDIYAIYSNDTGVGFVVEAEGLVIFHTGDHANRERDLSGDYLPEIEFIKDLDKEIDLAFMPVRGCNFGDDEAVRIGVYKTLDILQPNYFIPMHAGSHETSYLEFNNALTEAGYLLNKFSAIDKGDRFIYSY